MSTDTGPEKSWRNTASARQARLCLKELREILRDRRTIITLVLMPLLVYPLLSTVFHRLLMSSLPAEGAIECIVGLESEEARDRFEQAMLAGEQLLHREASQQADGPGEAVSPEVNLLLSVADDPREQLKQGMIDLVVLAEPADNRPTRDSLDAEDPRLWLRGVRWRLIHREGSALSDAALEYVESRFEKLALADFQDRLADRGDRRPGIGVVVREAVASSTAHGISLAALAPLVLILMTMTGAVYPAIDLTAGERERGTLEALVAAPIPRLNVLAAKYTAVLTVAVLTAAANLTAMTVTLLASGLGGLVFGEQGRLLTLLPRMFGLMVLFAAFFSAVLLTITSMARSFKEAQAYLIPLMLVCLAPGIVGMLPAIEFNAVLAVTPLVNLVLLARDMFEGRVRLGLAAAAIASTAVYALAALALAARVFGTDAILYGSEGTWSDLLRRPEEPRPHATPSSAMLALAALFPCYYLVGAAPARVPEAPISAVLIFNAAATALVFGGFAALACRVGRVAPGTGLGLSASPWPIYGPAVVLGAALWPLAHELFLVNQWLGLVDAARFEAIHEAAARFRSAPAWLVLLCLAAAPALFEEIFFRGFLQSTFHQVMKPRQAVLLSAALFGAFHMFAGVVLMPERLITTTFLGLALAWLRYMSGGVWPGVVLHFCNNALLLMVVYYQPQLAERGWGLAGRAHLPASWLAASAVLVTVAAAAVWAIGRHAAVDGPARSAVEAG